MTPASVFSRFPAARRVGFPVTAAAALFLSAASLRAQAPGSLDPNFNFAPVGSSTYAVDYQVDTDGNFVKITAGGDHALGSYYFDNGVAEADFLLAPFGNVARIIYTIVEERAPAGDNLLPNLLIGGQFDGGFGRASNNNKAVQNIIRIMPDGTIDAGFSAAIGTGANNYVTSLLPLENGNIVVGGLFTAVNHQPRRRVARLLNSGGLDANFATGANFDNDVLTLAESIDPITGQADGSTLVGGIFNHVGGQPYGKLARLDANGNLDMSFHPSIDVRVLAILVQSDGKIIIGGDFTNVNGTTVARLARLNYDGSIDPTFTGGVSGVPNKDPNPTAVYVLKALPDGRIYVGGEFAQFNGATREYLALMSPDGVLDTTFDPGKNIFDSVQSLAVQPNGNILVGQTVGPRVNNKYKPSLVRLFGVPPLSATTGPVTDMRTASQTAPLSASAQKAAPAEHVATSGTPAW